MNSTIVFVNSTSSRNLTGMQMKEVTRAFASAAILGGFAVLIQALSFLPKIAQIRKHLLTFISTPSKLVMFILLGQTPLRYSGLLNRISLADVVGVAGFGGLGLSILYTVQERFNSTSYQSLETSDINYQSQHRHSPQEQIKLDWALQEKIILLFVCEIYHAIVGVVLGVFAMRFFELCSINQTHLDLLMFSGFLGPIFFFSLFVLTTGIIFGISWAIRSRC